MSQRYFIVNPVHRSLIQVLANKLKPTSKLKWTYSAPHSIAWRTLSSSARGTPSQAYQSRVSSGEIEQDSHQVEVIKQLDRVYHELINYRPSPKESSTTTMFKGVFGFGGSNLSGMPKGLYIHGSVGGGKTFCMDLFHDVALVRRKLRVHFHSFMSDVHTRIHRVKQETVHIDNHGTKPRVYDPIPPVAAEIAEETWLLCFDEFQVSRFKHCDFFTDEFSCLLEWLG